MMRKIKRILAALLSVLTALMLLTVPVLAAGSIDLDRDVTLMISSQSNNKPLVGMKFSIYLVATVDECGELTTTEDFARFNVDIRGENDEAWRALASTLEGAVLLHHIKPADSGMTGSNGQVAFPSDGKTLVPGLYLVLGRQQILNDYYYEPSPFMVLLPGLDIEANAWDYDVEVNAKFDSEPAPPEDSTITRKVLKVWEDKGHESQRPQEVTITLLRDGDVYDTVTLNADNDWRYTWSELDASHRWTVVENQLEDYIVMVKREGITFVVTNTYRGTSHVDPIYPDNPSTPTNPPLPQTGQLWWPVPVLFAGGMLFVVIGLIRRRGARDEE